MKKELVTTVQGERGLEWKVQCEYSVEIRHQTLALHLDWCSP